MVATLCTATAACETLNDLTSDTTTKKADGTYKGDFQIVATVYDRSSGTTVTKTRSVSGAVGFTIQGDKVVTTDVAGPGKAIWDAVNKTMWVEFQSVASSNETACSKWRYYGGLLESDQFLKGSGDITCVAPTQDYAGWGGGAHWKVTRQ